MDKKSLIIDIGELTASETALLQAAVGCGALNLRAVTITGNGGMDGAVKKGVQELLCQLGRPEIPVAEGVSGKMLPGGPLQDRRPREPHAVDLIAQLARQEKISLLTVGPLGNAAAFLLCFPELTGQIEEIAIGGGALFRGDAGRSAEKNIAADPESAAAVFAGNVPLTLFPVDVTGRAQELGGQPLEPKKLFPLVWLLDPQGFFTLHTCVDIDLCGEVTRGQTVIDARAEDSNNFDHYYETQHRSFIRNARVVRRIDEQARARLAALFAEQ